MRNIDRIRQMSLEELAPLLVKDETVDYTAPCYSSPSGLKFWIEDDAVEDCIEWLNSEHSETNLSCEGKCKY